MGGFWSYVVPKAETSEIESPESEDELPVTNRCSICYREYVEPKITPCGHTFCKECLQRCFRPNGTDHLILDCPICRRLWNYQRNEVNRLPTNFSTIENIDAYHDRGSQRTSTPVIRTSHSSAPLVIMTMEDESIPKALYIEICKQHDKPLMFFCTTCGRPICNSCKKVEHSTVDHEVKPHGAVIKQERNELISNLEIGERKVTELDRQAVSVSLKQKNDTARFKELYSSVEKKIDDAVERNKKVIEEREEEIKRLEKQSAENRDQNLRLGAIKQSVLERIRVDHEFKQSSLECCSSKIASEKAQLNEAIKEGQRLTAADVALMSGLRDDMRGAALQLKGLVNAKKNCLTPLKDCETKFDAHACGVTELLQELSESVETDRENTDRELNITMADAGLEYFVTDHYDKPVKATPSCCLEVPGFECKDRKCCPNVSNVEVKSVVLMSKSRLAVCCVTNCPSAVKKQKVLLWNSYTDRPTVAEPLLTDDDKVEYVYLTQRGENELVLLRRKNPIINILNIDHGPKNKPLELSVPDLAQDDIDGLWQVGADFKGNFFLNYFTKSNEQHIAMVDGKGGTKIFDVKIRLNYCDQLASSQSTREIITSSFYNDSIVVYRVHDNCFEHVQSSPHKVNGLGSCTDICAGSLGDIFVVGRMKGDDKLKKVCKIVLSRDSRKVERYEELYQMISQSDPRCSVHNNRLVISDGHKLILLYLR